MTKFAWAMIGFIGVIIASFGAFVWIEANRAISLLGILSSAMGEGYGPLHITYQQADAYQAGGIAGISLGAFLALVAIIRMVQTK